MAKHKHLEKRSLLKVAVFGTVTAAAITLSVFGLMWNSQGAVDRYETLKAVDAAGGDVEAALTDLRGYIYSHMNTRIGSDLGIHPPIQLQGTYARLVQAEQDRVSGINEALQPEAIAHCEAQNPSGFSGRYRIDCIAEYVDTHGARERVIEDDLYKFDFVPPVWSPDLAGFSILAAAVFGLCFIVQLILYIRTRSIVRLAN